MKRHEVYITLAALALIVYFWYKNRKPSGSGATAFGPTLAQLTGTCGN